MKAEIFPLFRKKGIVNQDAQNELLIYDLKTNQAFCLNQTSALVYEMCDGTKSVAEISQSLSSKIKSPVTEEFVWLAIEQLKKNNLLEQNQELIPEYGGLSRRQIIKKIGLGTMVALPLVSSIIAPTSAQAQSAGTVPGGCNPNNVCNGAVVPGVTACDCTAITCPPGTNVGAIATVGVCVTAAVAAGLGVNLTANVHGFVCVEAAACVDLTP
jgi:hypothetical protein